MAAAVIRAKQDHGPGAHARDRFQTRTGNLERSFNITQAARRGFDRIFGRWGSADVRYARRIELGFQGKDAKGRTYDQEAFPALRPAASVEYPKLAERIRKELLR